MENQMAQHQIQEMEAIFQECPHPDEKHRKEIAEQLGLDPIQVRFWFQNKRTQMKSLNERSENSNLQAENELLRYENMMLREALTNPSCQCCGGPPLKLENIKLKQQYEHVVAFASKLAEKPSDGPGDQ